MLKYAEQICINNLQFLLFFNQRYNAPICPTVMSFYTQIIIIRWYIYQSVQIIAYYAKINAIFEKGVVHTTENASALIFYATHIKHSKSRKLFIENS